MTMAIELAHCKELIAISLLSKALPENSTSRDLVSEPATVEAAEIPVKMVANNISSSKSTVKRPQMLATKKKSKVLIRNGFHIIAKQCFYFLLNLLGHLLTAAMKEKDNLYGHWRNESKKSYSTSRMIDDIVSVNPDDRSSCSDSLDPIDFLLPAQIIKALAIFLKCSLQTFCEK